MLPEHIEIGVTHMSATTKAAGRLVTAAISLAVTAGLGLAAVPHASAAPEPTWRSGAGARAGAVSANLFGMHPASSVPRVPVGSVRLWDTGTRWAEMEPVKGQLNLAPLESRVTALRAAGVRDIMYVLGSTPAWAASSLSDRDLYGPGTSSHPADIGAFELYVAAVVRQFKGRITSYQVWNEANLSSFYRGTPAQMADLTLRVRTIVKANDPAAKVVAASTGTRLLSAYRGFYPRYLAELRARGWPIDAFAGHFYPASTGNAATRLTLIAMLKADLAKAKAPARPLYDTEINYGLKGPGPAFPDRDLEGASAAIAVSRTYLDSVRSGIARAYWYSWTPKNDLLGVTMYPGTVGAVTYSRVHSWLANSTFRGCVTSGTLTSCAFVKSRKAVTVRWTERGTRVVVVPPGARTACPAFGRCVAVKPGGRYVVTPMPVRFA